MEPYSTTARVTIVSMSVSCMDPWNYFLSPNRMVGLAQVCPNQELDNVPGLSFGDKTL